MTTVITNIFCVVLQPRDSYNERSLLCGTSDLYYCYWIRVLPIRNQIDKNRHPRRAILILHCTKEFTKECAYTEMNAQMNAYC